MCLTNRCSWSLTWSSRSNSENGLVIRNKVAAVGTNACVDACQTHNNKPHQHRPRRNSARLRARTKLVTLSWRVLLVGGIGGVRLEPNGGGLVWRGPTPKPDAIPATEEKWREKFSDNEDLLFVCGPVPFSIVSQHIAKWRS